MRSTDNEGKNDRSKTMFNHENERKTQKKNNVEHGKIL